MTAALYTLAALAEIGGCYAFWMVLRGNGSPWLMLPGLGALLAFAFLLTRIDSAAAGRAFAAYGGIYIVASLAWMALVEGQRPDRWDLAGALICLAGAAVIVAAPRGG